MRNLKDIPVGTKVYLRENTPLDSGQGYNPVGVEGTVAAYHTAKFPGEEYPFTHLVRWNTGVLNVYRRIHLKYSR